VRVLLVRMRIYPLLVNSFFINAYLGLTPLNI
jgi:hypothetical protein